MVFIHWELDIEISSLITYFLLVIESNSETLDSWTTDPVIIPWTTEEKKSALWAS